MRYAVVITCTVAVLVGCGCDAVRKLVGGESCKLGEVEACKEQCDDGKLEQCMTLGRSYQMGEPRFDRVAAVRLFDKACKKKHGPACMTLSLMVDNKHFKGTYSPPKAKELLKQACDAKDEQGCVHQILKGMDTEEGDKAAFEKFGARCKKGDQLSCKSLGWMHRSGHHVKKDAKKSIEIFQKSCDAGGLDSCAELAEAYANGWGVDKNLVKAHEIWTKACEKDSAEACVQQGMAMTESSTAPGEKPDKKKGFELNKKACDLFDMLGCSLTASVYEDGEEGVAKQDMQLAHKYYTRSCLLGLDSSCEDAALIDLSNRLGQPDLPE